MMTLEQVFAKAKQTGDAVVLVQDNEIFYLVLTKDDNTISFEIMAKLNECLAIVEKSQGPAVLVTIGVGEKIFCTGFDLPFWQAGGVFVQLQSIIEMQLVFDRFLTLGVPTLCVMNGHTVAGGCLLSLMHDFRIMKDDNRSFFCLSEINIGIPLSPAFSAIVKYQLDNQVARLVSYGGRFKAPQCKELKVVDSTYKNIEELQKYIQNFAKEFAPKGEDKVVLKDLKVNLHHDTHMRLIHSSLTKEEILGVGKFHKL